MKSAGLALLLALACQKAEGAKPAPLPAQNDITAEDYAMPPLPTGKVTLVDAFGGKHVVDVEIAASHDARQRGLMWRRELKDGKGMLFIFKEPAPLTFWMKNTLIPLDMIFIDKDLKIVGAVERAEPKTLQSRGVAGLSMFVLEVPSGWFAKTGLKAGSPVTFEGAANLKVEP